MEPQRGRKVDSRTGRSVRAGTAIWRETASDVRVLLYCFKPPKPAPAASPPARRAGCDLSATTLKRWCGESNNASASGKEMPAWDVDRLAGLTRSLPKSCNEFRSLPSVSSHLCNRARVAHSAFGHPLSPGARPALQSGPRDHRAAADSPNPNRTRHPPCVYGGHWICPGAARSAHTELIGRERKLTFRRRWLAVEPGRARRAVPKLVAVIRDRSASWSSAGITVAACASHRRG